MTKFKLREDDIFNSFLASNVFNHLLNIAHIELYIKSFQSMYFTLNRLNDKIDI